MTKTNGHPIRWHSSPPTEQYHQMPNSITRDNTLGNNGYRVLGILYSHAEGYEVSANRIAKEMGWGWRKAESGLNELEQARYLVIQKIVTARGTAVSEVYHIKPDGQRFTEDEVSQLSTTVILPDPLPKRQNPLCQNDIGTSVKTTEPPLSKRQNPPLSKRQNKENQLKDQIKDQREDQAEHQPGRCVLCAQPLGDCGQTYTVEDVHALKNGTAHDVCWIRWLIEHPDGKRHHRAIKNQERPTTDPDTTELWDTYHAEFFYEDFTERGLIPGKESKAK